MYRRRKHNTNLCDWNKVFDHRPAHGEGHKRGFLFKLNGSIHWVCFFLMLWYCDERRKFVLSFMFAMMKDGLLYGEFLMIFNTLVLYKLFPMWFMKSTVLLSISSPLVIINGYFTLDVSGTYILLFSKDLHLLIYNWQFLQINISVILWLTYASCIIAGQHYAVNYTYG